MSEPQEMKNAPRWVGWRYEERDGKRTKVPYDPKTGQRARSTDPGTWATYEEAKRAFSDQIGFVLGDGWAGVDFDNCFDEQGKLDPAVRRIVEQLSSYTEVTPSGRGLHVIVKCSEELPRGVRRKRTDWPATGMDTEVYTDGRYFTVTGQPFELAPLEVRDRTAVIHGLARRMTPEKAKQERRAPAPVSLDDAELLRKAREAANGRAFAALYDHGDISGHGNDHSAADLAACNLLAFWSGGDPNRMDRLFRSSALMRDKWDRSAGGGETYGQRTIRTALADCGEFYEPRVPTEAPMIPSRPPEPTPARQPEQLPPKSSLERRAVANSWASIERATHLVTRTQPADFQDDLARAGRATIERAVRAGESITPILVRDLMGDGFAELEKSVDPGASERDAARWLEAVIGAAAFRAVVRELSQLRASLKADGSNLEASVTPFIERLNRCIHRREGSSAVHIRKAMGVLAVQLSENEEKFTGLTTGFSVLDRNGGIPVAGLTIIAGRPGMGKSSVTSQIALNIAKHHGAVLYGSGEMSATDHAARIIGQERGVSPPTSGLAYEMEERLADVPLYILDHFGPRGKELQTFLAAVERHRLRHPGAKAVVVDHLGHLGRRDYEFTTEASRELQALSRRTGLAVIVLCQLSRELTKRTDKTPQLADLRESGHLEQDADLVLMLHRPAMFAKRANEREAWLYVRKRRNGALADIRLKWDAKLTRFEDAAWEPQESSADDEWAAALAAVEGES